jgi:Rieske Fe-S protein
MQGSSLRVGNRTMAEPRSSRREFLGPLTVALLGVWSGALALLGAVPLLSPLWRRMPSSEKRILLGPPSLADGPDPQGADVVVTRQSGYFRESRIEQVFVLPRQEDEFVAVSARCTHLGCQVSWNRSERRFECPCHGGRFDPHGNVIAGPPRSPLRRLPVVKEHEALWITLI